jgi:signal transduction histidine kinase
MQSARPHRSDIAIAVAGLVCGIVLWALGLENNRFDPIPRVWQLPPLVVMACAEVVRRTAPRGAVVVGFAALAADTVTGGNIATIMMFTDLVYASALYAPLPWARRVAPAALVVSVAATAVALGILRQPQALLVGLFAGLVTLTPAWTGWIIRTHRDEAAAERLRAEQTALLAEMDRRAAVTQERARMARELHDVVANHLSAIAIHSTAAISVAANDPEATRQALGVIRESSVQGLAEMRRLIGLLRDGGGGDPGGDEAAAVPRLDSLDAMIARAGRSGAKDGFTFELDDRRSSDAALPAPVELAAYRIVQESLTNALKHAAPGPVTVRLRHRGGRLVVTVESACVAAPDGPRAPGARAGLVGMRERAALLGGTFEAGPCEGGLWRVRAELPCGSETSESRGTFGGMWEPRETAQ